MMNDELLNEDEKFYNDELLNDDEKFYNDENELLNDEGKFYNQKSRNMMVPKNEFRHHNIKFHFRVTFFYPYISTTAQPILMKL